MTIKSDEITAFVGKNDAGKSNILRALNLFFNNETDHNVKYSFLRDYNSFAKTSANKAKEIIIEITILLPLGYQKKDYPKEIIWRKAWREEGLHEDGMKRNYVGGYEFPNYSKIPVFLDRIKYEYVPAVKDKKYFLDLQGKVHDVISDVAEKELLTSAKDFEGKIQEQLQDLLKSISDSFGESNLKLPRNLRQIFENLEFNRDGIPLSQRGDGIKIRHIPRILRFLAEKRNILKTMGGVKYTQIWGFEEPENNVEMGSCFEMSNEFCEAAKQGFQLFITTHSPIFYTLGPNEKTGKPSCKFYYIEIKDKVSSITFIEQRNELDEKMGLMPIVAPFIREKNAINEELRIKLANREEAWKKPTIFVEGKNDARIFTKAIGLFYPELSNRIIVDCGDNTQYGSSNALVHRAHIWYLLQKLNKEKVPAIAVFDNDESGRKGHSQLKEIVANSTYVYSHLLQMGRMGKVFREKGIQLPVTLESFYPDTIWSYAKTQGWLEKAKVVDRVSDSTLESLIENPTKAGLYNGFSDVEKIRIKHDFSDEGKEKCRKYILSLRGKNLEKALFNFNTLLKDIITKILPHTPSSV